MRRRDSMPTPSDDDETLDISRSSHPTCPPEDDRSNPWRTSEIDESHRNDSDVTAILNQLAPPSASHSDLPTSILEQIPNNGRHSRKMDIDDGSSSQELMSPVSIEDKQEENVQAALSSGYIGGSSYDFSSVRVRASIPHTLKETF